MCNIRAALLEDLPDANFQSSSNLDPDHGPKYSRLSTRNNYGPADAWVAPFNAPLGQWIEVDFSEQKTLEAVELRPRVTDEQWVSSYKLAFSNDSIEYSFVKIVKGEDWSIENE